MGEALGALFTDPLLGGLAAVLVAASAVVLALWMRSTKARRKVSNPLAGFLQHGNIEARALVKDELRAPRPERRKPASKAHRTTAMLRSRIDHLSQVRHIWGPETRAEAIEQVAQVMRGGVREGDIVRQVEEDGFVILAPGASERDASNIAKRLRAVLARKYIAGMGTGLHLTASFGVAEVRGDESEEDARVRADEALEAAQGSGEEQVLAASDWEEVILLPAPDGESDDKAAA